MAEEFYFLIWFFNLFQSMPCIGSQYRALGRCEFLGFQADNEICFHLSEQRKICKKFESQDTQTTSLESVTSVWNPAFVQWAGW